MTSSTGQCGSDWHHFLSIRHDRGWSSLAEIQSRPVWQRCIYAPPCSLTYCILLQPLRIHMHTWYTWDQQVCVFSGKPIFSPHESTTGGTWCYINAPRLSLSVLFVLWALPFTFLPIDSHLLEYKSPANQTWPSGYQQSYGVSVVWYVGWLSVSTTHIYCIQECCGSVRPQWTEALIL